MCVHKAKCQYGHFIILEHNKYPVHPPDEIRFIIKQPVHSAAVCVEMPTIIYRMVFPLDKRFVNGKVRLNLPEQLIINLHLHFQRLQWSLLCKFRINRQLFKEFL